MSEHSRCIANLYALAKKKGIKIKDLEVSCGVSVGYLSRLRQDKKSPLPGTEFLLRAAVLLDTTVDSLLYFDFQLASDTDQYLYSFISRLTLDTLSDKLRWAVDEACVPDPVILEGIVFPDHPLLGLDPVLLQEEKSKAYYASPFHPAVYDLVPEAAWRASLSENTVVFLTRVASDTEGCAGETEMYLYHIHEKALSPLCHTDTSHSGILDRVIGTLCETVSESLRRTALDRIAVSAIDAYMNKGGTA